MQTHCSDFSSTDLSTYLTSFPAAVFEIKRTTTMENIQELIQFLKSTQDGERKYCLISYQGHWMALDIAKRDALSPLSIVCLDAANNIHRVAALLQILGQIGLSPFRFMHLCSPTPLQRNSNACAAFAIELLRFSRENPNFHEDLPDLINSTESKRELAKYAAAITRILRGLGHEDAPIRAILAQLQQDHVLLINYDKLIEDGIDKWAGFFLNSQAEIRHPRIEALVEKWLIQRRSPSDGHFVMHNLRIDYQSYLIRTAITAEAPKTEDEFIVSTICEIHGEVNEASKLGLVLRKAIALGLVSHVKALLSLTTVDVNECPRSGFTALDRAEALAASQAKTEILQLLSTGGARRGRELSTSLFGAGGVSHDARTLGMGK